MKKTFIWVCLTVAGIAMSSCAKNNDTLYSCDQEVDSWVKGNLKEITKLTRADIKSLDPTAQRGIYRALTPSQRKSIWIGKINEALSLNFNTEEKAHIEKLIPFINENNFIFETNERNATDEQIDKLTLFVYDWTEYAIENLHWSMETCKAIISDFSETKVKTINSVAQVSTVNTGLDSPLVLTRSESDGKLKDCNCNLSSIFYDTCESVPCNETTTGCGGFTFFTCDGRHSS